VLPICFPERAGCHMKFTTQTIGVLKLKPGEKDALYWDDSLPGFGVRLREGGSKNFIFQYRIGDKQRRITIGSTAIGLIKARDTAKDMHATVRLGGDPAGEKQQARHDAGHTFRDLGKQFLEAKSKSVRPRTFADVERHINKHAKPLHGLQVAKISRGDVKALLVGIARNRGEVTANRVQTTLSTFFAWCIEHSRCDLNPVVGISRFEEQSRDRVLFPAELRAIWKNLDTDHYGAVIKLLALTGQRASEMAGLRWSEINEEGDTIDLPAERTKNGRRHFVPLASPARAIIEAQPRRSESDGAARDLIFGLRNGPFSGWSNCKEALDAKIEEEIGKPLAHWTPHDLRRSMSTYMGGGLGDEEIRNLPPEDRKLAEGLQIAPHVIEAVLNHVSGTKAGVHGIYNRSPYAREKRHALELWADRLMAIVEGRETIVTPLKRA